MTIETIKATSVEEAIGTLADVAARVLQYPEEKIHGMARQSALDTVWRNPGCTVADVVRDQYLVPQNAERALRQLCEMGQIKARATGGYEVVAGLS